MSWHPAPPRAPAPWWRAMMSVFTAPNAVTRTGVGLSITEAVAELADAVRELAQVVRDANNMNRPDDDT